MVGQTPKDTPFGMEPNVAAGLAYLLSLIGGIVMLAGGGTNKFVKWAACQSITFFAVCFVIRFALGFLAVFASFLGNGLWYAIFSLVNLVFFVGWLYTWIMAFQGKEVRLPLIGDLTENLFKSQLA